MAKNVTNPQIICVSMHPSFFVHHSFGRSPTKSFGTPPIHLGYETQIFCVFRTNSFGTRYAQFKCAHTNHLYASVPIHLVPPNHLDCFVPIHLVRIIAGWETRPLQKESTLKFKVDFLFRFCSRSKPFKWDAGFDFFDPSAI